MNIQAFRAPAVQAYQATSSVKRTAAPAVAAQPSTVGAQAAAPGLEQDEQQMISRYFPASSEMSMRLYGPGRGAQSINPAALGRHLDLQG